MKIQYLIVAYLKYLDRFATFKELGFQIVALLCGEVLILP